MSRDFVRKISSLADPEKKAGIIRFVHKDGTERTFVTVVNRQTGSRMSWFDDCAPWVTESEAWPKSVFRDIRRKAKVLECVGDF
jgi:hypothetical protein